MTYIALLRAVNVGGTGLLPMKDLVRLCEDLGFTHVRTYIQSGNVIFQSPAAEPAVLATLQQALHIHMGKPVDVMLRTADHLRRVLETNPFPDREPAKVAIAFLHGVPPAEANGFTGPAGERVVNGARELYVDYPEGIGRSKLKLPLGKIPATIRNVNTIAKLVQLSAA